MFSELPKINENVGVRILSNFVSDNHSKLVGGRVDA